MMMIQIKGLDIGYGKKKVIQDYIVMQKRVESDAPGVGIVSDETVNGRIRAYRRFWNHLTEEKLWKAENPMNGIKPLRTAILTSIAT